MFYVFVGYFKLMAFCTKKKFPLKKKYANWFDRTLTKGKNQNQLDIFTIHTYIIHYIVYNL